MKILIDGYYIKKILYNSKTYTKNELSSLYIKSLHESQLNIEKAIKYLIDNYNFTELQDSENDIYDYCIDTDTDVIYKPIY